MVVVMRALADRPIVEGGRGSTGGILLLNAGPYFMLLPPLDVV